MVILFCIIGILLTVVAWKLFVAVAQIAISMVIMVGSAILGFAMSMIDIILEACGKQPVFEDMMKDE